MTEQSNDAPVSRNNRDGKCPGDFMLKLLTEGVKREVDHEEFIINTLQFLCWYYGAEWSGVISVDLPLGSWNPEYWYDAKAGGRSDTLLYDYEPSAQFEHWVLALENEQMLVYKTIEDVKKNCPDEYEQYVHLGVNSFMGIPYYRGGTGFIVIKNPTENQDKPFSLIAADYSIGHELHALQELEAAGAGKGAWKASAENEIRFSVFGGLRIQVSSDPQKEIEVEDKTVAPVLLYLLLKENHTAPSREICEKIWDDPSQKAANRVKTAIRRFRDKYRDEPPFGELISSGSTGYCLRRDYVYSSDKDDFDDVICSVESKRGKAEQIRLLTQAVSLYLGSVCPVCRNEKWLSGIAAKYEMSFRKVFNRLMQLLEQSGNYRRMVEASQHALRVTKPTDQIYGWAILAMYRNKLSEQAFELLMKAKENLTARDFQKMQAGLTEAQVIFQNAR